MSDVFEACQEARSYASLQLDEELSELDEARLHAHLSTCPACARWADEAGALALLLREAELETPAELYRMPARRLKIPHASGVAATAASVAAVALAVAAVTVPSAGRHVRSGNLAEGPATAGITCSSCDVARAFVREDVLPSHVRHAPLSRRYPEPT